MGSDINPGIAKLQGRVNYESWKFAVQALLDVDGLWDIVVGDERETDLAKRAALDRKAKARLVLAVDPVNFTHINSETTAKGVWDKLKSVFDDTGLSRRVGLLRTLISTRLDQCDSMEEFVNQITSNAQKLNGAGMKISDEWIASLLLAGLSPRFEPMIMAIESSGVKVSSDQIKTQLLQDARPTASASHNGESSMYTRNATTQRPNNKKTHHHENNHHHHHNGGQQQSQKCFNCGKPGHYARDCRTSKRKDGGNGGNGGGYGGGGNGGGGSGGRFGGGGNGGGARGRNESNWSCLKGEYDAMAWYIDSGATAHMTSRCELLQNVCESSSSATVTVANNTTLKVKGEGTVKLMTNNTKVTIHKVLYVPEICANLLSVSAMVKKGMRLEFHQGGCDIRDVNGETVATAKIVNGMYRLEVASSSTVSRSFAVKQDCTAMLWHKRLGHTGFDSLRRINSSWISNGSSCETCILGKHSRQPFGDSATVTKSVLEIVHSDVCGPMQVASLQSSRYFVTFIDDHSRKVVVYCLEKKSMVLEVFKEFKARAENQTGKKIGILRSDNGTEYCNHAMKDFLRSAGIMHQTTVPYTPEQNGVAERMNRTLVEKARCMLFEAKLSTKFWAEAVITAAYIINRIPSKSCKKSPEEIWSTKAIDLTNIRIFGCKVMAHIPKEKRGKFDPKSRSCIFVGYCNTSKGYRLYDEVTRKIFISRDVKFFEEENGAIGEVDVAENNHFYLPKPIRNEVEEMTATIGNDDGSNDGSNDGSSDGRNDNDERDGGNESDGDGDDTEHETDDFLDADYVPDTDVTLESVGEPRRSTRIRNPVIRHGYVSHAVEADPVLRDPVTPDQALSGNDADKWKKAMSDEYNSLIENGTWTLEDLPPGRKAIANKWVFKTKYGGDGRIDRYKARLVVKGCSQRKGIDYAETFSPVVRYTSIRFLIAIAAKMDLEIDQMDVVTAFLQGDLKEEVYMRQPDTFDDGTARVCRLQKSLYGLKQASRCWNEKLGAALLKAGLNRSRTDTCIYSRINGSDVLIVAVYVDDLLIFSSNAQSKQRIKDQLQATFKMTDNGKAKFILGMHIERDRAAGTISINQHKYLNEILERFNMADCNPVSTPVDVNAKLSTEMAPKDEAGIEEMRLIPYQEAVGSVLFAAQISRPDIQYAVNMVSRYNHNPGRAHWNAVKRILRYLRGTINMKLTYRRDDPKPLHGFCDADWANDVADRRSVTGYVFIMQGGAVSWNSRKQQTVALSTTEAEYMAMAAATQEAIWLRNLQNELFSHTHTITIYGDNKSALMLSEKTTTFHPRTKHIDIKHHFIRDEVTNGTVQFTHTRTEDMTADTLTKAISAAQHIKCREGMNLH